MKGTVGKSPSIQWYYKDWLSDRKLQRAHPTARGIWINLLMHMIDCSLDEEDCKEGVLEDITIQELMQLGSCNENDAWLFIEEALKQKFCNIELDKNVTFHIMSRRLLRDSHQRYKWRERQQKKRKRDSVKQSGHEGVTPKSPTTPTPTPIPTLKGNALSKDKAGSSPPSSPPPKLPLPGSKTSKHYSSKIPNCSEIDTACREIQELGGKNGAGFNPFSFVQEAVNKSQHPSAILEALLGIIKGWNDIRSPYAWGQAILKTKSQNYNEAEHRKQTETFRKEWAEFAKHAFA